MKNKLAISVVLLCAAILGFAFISKNDDNGKADGGIRFMESNWQKAKEEAKKQHKLIFLDAYATWCGPCRMLKKQTFPNKEAGDFFNQHFINVAMDMEKGDGPALSEQFRIEAYPTLIIADEQGNAITYTKGFIEPKQLIEFGQYGLSLKKK